MVFCNCYFHSEISSVFDLTILGFFVGDGFSSYFFLGYVILYLYIGFNLIGLIYYLVFFY